MGHQFGVDRQAVVLPLSDRFAETGGIPVDYDGGEEVQPSHSVVLALAGAVADFALASDAKRVLERVMSLSLVQTCAGTALHIGVEQPVHDEQRSFHPSDFAESDGQFVLTGIGGELSQQLAGRKDAAGQGGRNPQDVRPVPHDHALPDLGAGQSENDNYAALLDHYGLRSTLINSGKGHENGVAEHAHYRLKDAVDQALIMRGSRDFHTGDDYAHFVQQMVEKRNRLVRGKLEQELAWLRPLPPAPMLEYANYQSKVRRWSTIQVAGRSYSVPSRLINKEVQIRLYSDHLEVYYKGHFVERMARVRGDGEVNVNYRHVINSLVRKPGAFARYRFREQLFPSMHFRLAYDALREWRGERADVEYVRILHLATTTMEANVDSALSLLLEAERPFDYAEVRELAEPKPPEAPALVLSGTPDLKVYDGLLVGSLAGSRACG